MTNFSTNQVMQFYVLDNTAEVIAPKNGEYAVVKFTDAAGEIKTSDKIENVMWGKLTESGALTKSYKQVTLTIKEGIVAGENYIVRVAYPEVAGLGVEGYTTKTASVYAKEGDSAETIYNALAKALNTAFAADGMLRAIVGDDLFIVQTDATVKGYKRGLRPAVIVDFEVYANQITVEGELVDWATIKAVAGDGVYNGYAVADMEYFAMGERGDQYRMMGWPDVIETEYKVDPKKTYDVLNVHFAYKGDNANSHRSEKDLVIVAEVANKPKLEALAKAIETATKAKFTRVSESGEALLTAE